jgi:hypothetical protein
MEGLEVQRTSGQICPVAKDMSGPQKGGITLVNSLYLGSLHLSNL